MLLVELPLGLDQMRDEHVGDEVHADAAEQDRKDIERDRNLGGEDRVVVTDTVALAIRARFCSR